MILWFSIDEAVKVFPVALGALFPVYLNIYYGIRNIDRGLVEMVRSYGLSVWSLFIQVILPAPYPQLWLACV